MRMRLGTLMLAGLVSLGGVGLGWAAGFPGKPINLIVPYGAGGSTDVMARAIATVAPKHFPQPLVVINKPGGGGIPGRVDVVKSKADGYTSRRLGLGRGLDCPAPTTPALRSLQGA